MNFNITIDEASYTLELSEQLMQELQGPIAELDEEYSKGIQLGRYWLDQPDDLQRCQFAADKIVSAIYQENVRQFYLMSAYILSKFPTLKRVTVSSDYEISDIDLEL